MGKGNEVKTKQNEQNKTKQRSNMKKGREKMKGEKVLFLLLL